MLEHGVRLAALKNSVLPLFTSSPAQALTHSRKHEEALMQMKDLSIAA